MSWQRGEKRYARKSTENINVALIDNKYIYLRLIDADNAIKTMDLYSVKLTIQ